MALDTKPIIDAVVSHALTSGHFERVNAHEPTSAPGTGLSAAVWVDATEPARGTSGLRATTARLTLNVRLYTSMLAEPADAIDPRLMAAHDALMTAYSADFTLGDLVRCVDLLGQSGCRCRRVPATSSRTPGCCGSSRSCCRCWSTTCGSRRHDEVLRPGCAVVRVGQ